MRDYVDRAHCNGLSAALCLGVESCRVSAGLAQVSRAGELLSEIHRGAGPYNTNQAQIRAAARHLGGGVLEAGGTALMPYRHVILNNLESHQ